ncbi:hypothetical protein HG535_0E04130 [Zygotorulaspora mrakii]|uniref:Uncharacterized protein n=1 Tax=Zygotorulaspora mrakii TaxID=42260 RepID=A0A7H9B5T8_ZYGMR|nr:uncharacterized protein HG535_0E04130 [Zygotorulaspora mrakii]QLG73329.1 hypothetical protein HG535_0E04130 [Zygotorulaspora mrakii]
MNEFSLPGKLSVGAQLGLGVSTGGMHMSSRQNHKEQPLWVEPFDDRFICDLSKLHISQKGRVLGQLRPESLGDDTDHSQGLGDIEDDYSTIDEEDNERWRNLLLMNLNWDPIAPEIPVNFQPTKDVEYDSNRMYDVRGVTEKSTSDYLPTNLISDLSESGLSRTNAIKRLQERQETTFDPTVGNLFAIGSIQTPSDLRNGNEQHHVLAYCSGRTNSFLTLAVLKKEYDAKAAILKDTDIGDPITFDFKATIKSIKFPTLSPLLGRNSDCIGIITENALHVVRIDSINAHSLEIYASTAEALAFSEFGDFPFADMAFNPWDLQQFAIVDIRGNFSLGRIQKNFKHGSKIRLLKEFSGSFFDPEELSNWKRIEWSSSHGRLLVMDRSKMLEVDFEQDWQLEVIQAKSWSTLRDYKRLDDDFGVLLTSSEIILIRTAEGADHIAREISWKHDLDPRDPTLRMAIKKLRHEDENKNAIILCIFSRLHGQIYVHGFSISENGFLIRSTRDSSILNVPMGLKRSLDICFMGSDEVSDDYRTDGKEGQGSKNLHILVHHNDSGRFFHLILSDLKQGASNEQVSFEGARFAKEKLRVAETIPSANPPPEKVSKHIKCLLHRLLNPKRDLQTSDAEILQNYGYKLSEEINNLIETWSDNSDYSKNLQPLLKDLVEIPNEFENLEEFSSFLEQLFDHYGEQSISCTRFPTLSNMILHETVENLEIFHSKVLQCWGLTTSNAEAVTKEVIKSLVWSLTRLCKPTKYEEMSTKISESLIEPYSEIFDCWGGDHVSESSPTSSSTFRFGVPSEFPMSSQSQIPTIKSSQPRASRHTRRDMNSAEGRVLKPVVGSSTRRRAQDPFSSQTLPSTLPDAMTPAFTLMQPSSMLTSQSQSSQRQKRRKRRIGGFG